MELRWWNFFVHTEHLNFLLDSRFRSSWCVSWNTSSSSRSSSVTLFSLRSERFLVSRRSFSRLKSSWSSFFDFLNLSGAEFSLSLAKPGVFEILWLSGVENILIFFDEHWIRSPYFIRCDGDELSTPDTGGASERHNFNYDRHVMPGGTRLDGNQYGN